MSHLFCIPLNSFQVNIFIYFLKLETKSLAYLGEYRNCDRKELGDVEELKFRVIDCARLWSIDLPFSKESRKIYMNCQEK